jgi:hypothetical protein
VLRKVLSPLSTVEAMELLLSRLTKTKSNIEFLGSMSAPTWIPARSPHRRVMRALLARSAPQAVGVRRPVGTKHRAGDIEFVLSFGSIGIGLSSHVRHRAKARPSSFRARDLHPVSKHHHQFPLLYDSLKPKLCVSLIEQLAASCKIDGAYLPARPSLISAASTSTTASPAAPTPSAAPPCSRISS